MALTLHIGVIDVAEPEGGTTGSVAEDLEKRYSLFTAFADSNIDYITESMVEDASDMIEAIMSGEPIGKQFSASGDLITTRFKQFIANSEDEKLGLVGVPTQAALAGTSLRTKGGKSISKVRKGAKYIRVYGAKRPSFIYSGILQASLKCWVE